MTNFILNRDTQPGGRGGHVLKETVTPLKHLKEAQVRLEEEEDDLVEGPHRCVAKNAIPHICKKPCFT